MLVLGAQPQQDAWRIAGVAVQRVALATGMAYGVTAWLLAVHAGGGHDRRSLSPLAHLLRDGTLALPAVAVVVAMALALADRLCADHRAPHERLAVAVGLLALLTAAASGSDRCCTGCSSPASTKRPGG